MTALTRELERTRNGAKIMERTLEAAKGEIVRLRQELADAKALIKHHQDRAEAYKAALMEKK